MVKTDKKCLKKTDIEIDRSLQTLKFSPLKIPKLLLPLAAQMVSKHGAEYKTPKIIAHPTRTTAIGADTSRVTPESLDLVP